MIITNLEKFVKNVVDGRLKNFNSQNLFNALDKMFPDKWELQYSCNFEKEDIEKTNLPYILGEYIFFANIIIHFPEIVITDGKLKHTITNVYVKLTFIIEKNYDGSYVGIEGTRSSYTLSEIKNNYCHSHLPRIYTGNTFSSFCLGSGPIRNYLKGINRTEEEWLFFFNLLNQYLRWESIAGRPYKHISGLGTYGEPPLVGEYVVDQILQRYKIKNIRHKITDNSIEVIPSEDMEEELAKLLSETIYKEYLCYKNTDGEYLVRTQTQLAPHYKNYNNAELFTFKGELLKLKILNERTDEQDNFTTNAPVPDLTKKLCTKLSNKLTEAYIKRSRVKSEDTSKSAQECSRENEVLVL